MNENKFKWDAKLYQKSSSFQYSLGLMAIERLNPKNFEKVLEIGGGNAMLSIEIAKLIPDGEITIIEVSKEMCEQAKENLVNFGIENVKIVNMDALKINNENEFDVVFSNSAIHWIKDLELMYTLIYKSLRNNGRIMVQTGLKEVNTLFQTFLTVGKEFAAYLKDFTLPWRFLTAKENEIILTKNNFKEIIVEPKYLTKEFDNEDNLMDYFKGAAFVPYFDVLPDNIKDKFVERFKEIFFELNQPNPLNLGMTRVFINATKKI